MATEYFVVVDRDGVVIHSRVGWETISELLRLMMVRRAKRSRACFSTITDTPEQLAQVRAIISKRVRGSVIAEDSQAIKREHFSNDKGSGWYYELRERPASTYAAAVEEFLRAA